MRLRNSETGSVDARVWDLNSWKGKVANNLDREDWAEQVV